MIARRTFRPGDLVVYRKTKHSVKPGPRATRIIPAPNGDTYCYNVDKFWVVERVTDSGQLVLRTRTGKTHTAPPDDPNLRRAGLITRLLYSSRFPAAERSGATS